MRLIKFPGHNVVFAENQPEYLPLPAYKTKYETDMPFDALGRFGTGEITCCWKLNLAERVRLLWSGKLWHTILTYNHPLQPQMLDVKRPSHIP